jgi:hypothetical protein
MNGPLATLMLAQPHNDRFDVKTEGGSQAGLTAEFESVRVRHPNLIAGWRSHQDQHALTDLKSSDYARLVGVIAEPGSDRRRALVEPVLQEEPVQMGLDGPGRDAELRGDLLIR